MSRANPFKKTILSGTVLLTVAASLPGCALFDKDLNLSGIEQVIDGEKIENPKLASLICMFLPKEARDGILNEENQQLHSGSPDKDCLKAKDSSENYSILFPSFQKCYISEASILPMNTGCNSSRDNLIDTSVSKHYIDNINYYIDSANTDMINLEIALTELNDKLNQMKDSENKPLKLSSSSKVSATTNYQYRQNIPAKISTNPAPTNIQELRSLAAPVAVKYIGFDQALNQLGQDVLNLQNEIDKLSEANRKTPSAIAVQEKIHGVNNAIAVLSTNIKSVNSLVSSSVGLGALYRNAIRERIVLAADRRCEGYKVFLTNLKNDRSFALSLLSTGSGLAGGMVAAPAANYLSGTSGFLTGTNTLIDDTYFQNEMIDVIIFGLNASRAEWRASVLNANNNTPLQDYSLEQAVGNAMQYNGLCTLPQALHYVHDKIRKEPDVTAVSNKKKVADFVQNCITEASVRQKDSFSSAVEKCKKDAEKMADALNSTTPTNNSTNNTK